MFITLTLISPYIRLDEEAKWLQWMEAQFSAIAGEDGEIDLDEFKKALGVKKVCVYFSLFTQNGCKITASLNMGENSC